jgi:hypothetical protein
MLERRDEVRRNEIAAIGSHVLKQIEADRIIAVGGIEVDAVVDAFFRHGVENGFRQIAVRIEKRESATGVQVLLHEGEQRRLARPGLANDVQVAAPIRSTLWGLPKSGSVPADKMAWPVFWCVLVRAERSPLRDCPFRPGPASGSHFVGWDARQSGHSRVSAQQSRFSVNRRRDLGG